MNLNLKNFSLLIKTIISKFNKDIVITSGKVDIKQLNIIKNYYFKQLKKDIFISDKFKNKLTFIGNTDFRDLEYIVKKSKEVICCEGAISHVSNAFDKKTLALINDLKIAKFWTSHMKNLTLIKRDNIVKICKRISLI